MFDVFEGGALAAEGKKSLAIEVTLQPTARDADRQGHRGGAQKIVAAVKKATGGEIRLNGG